MSKLIFQELTHVKHSGTVDPTHIKVMRMFEKSETNGIYYCDQRGWDVTLFDNILSIKSSALFGFEMSAIFRREVS